MILVDSDVLIAHLRGHGPARAWLRTTRSDGEVLAISPVSIAEITGGMRSGERREVKGLLESLVCLEISRDIGVRAGDLRRTYRRSHHSIGIADYLIAATAEVEGCRLATLNTEHFPMFAGLRPAFALDGE